MHVVQVGVGWIEVVTGPMFSGKSEELIRRVKRALIARQKLQVFKPRIDNRYHDTRVVSHSQQSFEAEVVSDSAELVSKLGAATKVVGIDEVQFFDAGIVQVAERLAANGLRVICAGLDQDFAGKPFEPVPALMSVAEYVTKTLAICAICGAPAGRTQRIASGGGGDSSSARVLVGATESYEPRCRGCHSPRAVHKTENLLF